MKKLTLIIGVCLLTFGVQAQSFVTINNDPVSTAMGETSVSLSASAFSIYNNTASAALDTAKWEAAYSYSPYMSEGNNLHTVAGRYKLGAKHTLAAGVRYFDKADVMLTDEYGASAGMVKPTDLSVELGYAFQINEIMGLSANVRLINSDLGVSDAKGTAVGFDLGYYMRSKGLSLGLELSNVGSQIEYGANAYDTPSWIKAGGSYEWLLAAKHVLTASVQGDCNFQPDGERGLSSGVGVEYAYDKCLFFRGGYRLADQLMGYNYATMGAGARYKFANINFAYIMASDAPINKTMQMSLGFSF